MLKQKIPNIQQTAHFQPLPCQSPQIKPYSQQQQIQDINLEDELEIKQKSSRKRRRNKLKEKETNLIKIKPVKNYEEPYEIQSNDLPETIVQDQSQNAPINQKQQNKQQNNDASNQTMESPVLYRMSDEQDTQPRQQTIPQSSRRPLKERTVSDKKSDSDQLSSPVKLIRSPRKARSRQHVSSQNQRRFIKMKKQVQLIEKREPTQIFEYEDDNHQSDQSSEENDSDPYQAQEEFQNEEIEEVQRQIKQKSKQQLKKPEITVFKSNSFYTLINAEIPKGNFVNCIIRRRRGEDYFEKMVIYQLYLLQDKKYLMTCIKDRLFKTTSHFEFYREKTNTMKYHKDNLYAYLDSNFTGTQFVLKTVIKNDTNSERSTAIDKSQLVKMEESTSAISDTVQKGSLSFSNQNKVDLNEQNIKTLEAKQVSFFSFKANFFGLAGQREVKLLKKKNKKLKQTGNFSDLKSAQDNEQIDKYSQINSKKAVLGKNGLQLDFKGVAKMQSTKNIILQAQSGKQALIFGKVKQDIYSVAIGSPLSIIQGLAFGIANLDRKFFVN